MYCLDSNFFISCWRYYYSPDISEDFWQWLRQLAIDNEIFIPMEVYEEIEVGKDDLFVWIKEIKVKIVRKLDEQTQIILNEIIIKPEAKKLVNTNKKHKADVFIVAYAKRYNATIVSNDGSVIELAKACNVRFMRDWEFLKEKKLKMKIMSWQSNL